MELEGMYADVQISRIWQLLFMPLMNLVCQLWIMLHTVKSTHSRRAVTFTLRVGVACAKLQEDKF